MLARKTEFKNLFSPNNVNKNDDIILNYFMSNISKMDECNSIKNDFHKTPNIQPNLNAISFNANISNEQQFRLNKTNEIKDYFLAEIR